MDLRQVEIIHFHSRIGGISTAITNFKEKKIINDYSINSIAISISFVAIVVIIEGAQKDNSVMM